MRPYIRTLQDGISQGSYAGAVKTDKINLPRDYLLQRILIDTRGTMNITVGASVLVQDAGQALMKGIRVNLSGGKLGAKTVVDLSGIDVFFINFYDYGRAAERVLPTAIANGVAVSWQLVLDFRLAKDDPDDFSVAIPMYDKSGATLVIDWDTPANGYGTNTSVWALTTKITLFEAIPESADEFAAGLNNPVLTITANQYATSAAAGDESRNTDVQVGALLRRIWFYSETLAGVRSDTEFNKITIRTPNLILFDKMDWYGLSMMNKADWNLNTYDGNRAVVGVAVLDFARGPFDERGRVYGFDSSSMKSGDMKLKINKANASSIFRVVQESVESVAA